MDCEECKILFSLNSPLGTKVGDRVEIKSFDLLYSHFYQSHYDSLSDYMKKVCKTADDKMNGRSHKGNGMYQGAFAFTLTMSPEDGLTEEDMVCAVQKIMAQESCPVKKFAWYLEYVDGKHPHIHGLYETESGGRIESKHFRRAWPIWNEKKKLGFGFRGGYHRPVKLDESYYQYISKDGGRSESKNVE